MMIQLWIGMVASWNRRALLPIKITSRSSFRNKVMIGSARIKLTTPIAVRATVATFTQNQKEVSTRSYRFAP